MQSILSWNKYSLIIIFIALLFGGGIVWFPEYYVYYLPILLIFTLVLIFYDRLKKEIHLLIWIGLLISPLVMAARLVILQLPVCSFPVIYATFRKEL